jgi:hypothetical protein
MDIAVVGAVVINGSDLGRGAGLDVAATSSVGGEMDANLVCAIIKE